MDFNKLNNLLAGEPAWRQKQVKQLVFCDLIDNWNQATTLPLKLRAKFEKEWPLEIEAGIFVSKDERTIKALFVLPDDFRIESVLMRHEGRNTVCVSSQVGCALACSFCATGRMGFKRNLTAGEIVSQVLFWARWLKKNNISPFEKGGLRGILKLTSPQPSPSKGEGEIHPAPPFKRRETEKVNNIVFMGMGEPLLNYDNVLAAIKMINDPKGLAIGARHISISTVGIIEGIERLAQETIQVNLAISLHAPTDELRLSLMPINKKYPIEKVLEAVDEYINKTRRKVMFEYIMIKGVNDSEEQARRLAKILKRPLIFINLIACNPTGELKPSLAAQIKKFKDILEKSGLQALQRYRFGEEIGAACGQLAGGKK